HLLTVVMDLSDSRPDNLRKSSEAVIKYLEKNLQKNDFVAIYFIERGLKLALPFTNDMAQARAPLDKVTRGAVTSSLSTSARPAGQRQISELYAQVHPEAAVGVNGEAAVVNAGRGQTPGDSLAPMTEREIATLRSYL